MALLPTLRAATREAHASIERRIPLMSAQVSRAQYADYLTGMLGFHAPVEARLSAMPMRFTDAVSLASRQKSEALRADLRALGRDVEPPSCEALPVIETIDHAYGVLYVLEGSTLGGAVLARHLAQRLDIQDCSRFLRVHGDALATSFRAFCEALEAHGEAPGCDPEAVTAAATETFRTLEAWLVQSMGL